MTPSEKEHYRWTFAGQAMTQLSWPEGIHYKMMAEKAIHMANVLIAELEETAPSRPMCGDGRGECPHFQIKNLSDSVLCLNCKKEWK